jgi:hypothetical protein
MTQIYESAFVTLAYNISTDSSQSLLLPSRTEEGTPSWHQSLNKAWGLGKAEVWWKSVLEGGPLGSRAWCFQERYLSTRLIHMTDNGLWLWECNSRTFCTLGTESLGRQPSMHHYNPRQTWQRLMNDESTVIDQSRVADILYQWHKIVEAYSRRTMTLEADKLPALSGLAHKVHDVTKSHYLAGLWKDDLPRSLLWIRNQNTNVEQWRRPRVYRAPSWSWCAIDGPVQLHSNLHQVQFRFLDAFMISTNSDPMGKLEIGSKICLSGRVRKFQVAAADSWKIGRSILDTAGMTRLAGGSSSAYGILCWDIPSESAIQEIWCLAIGTDSYAQYGLALMPTTAQKDEFYRIGVVTLVGLEWSSTSDEERDLTLL